jgi:hypothetical protein
MSLSPFDNSPQRSHRPDGPTVPFVVPGKRRRPARDQTTELPVSSDGWATCPDCRRTWLVTGADDVLLPECGCYGSDWSQANRWRPCCPCGLKHEQDCPDCEGIDTEDDAALPDQWSPGPAHIHGKGLGS